MPRPLALDRAKLKLKDLDLIDMHEAFRRANAGQCSGVCF